MALARQTDRASPEGCYDLESRRNVWEQVMSIDVTGSNSNPLATMLGKAFDKVDKNGDGSLDKQEFADFNEILKPGIAVDAFGKPTVDYSEKMDQNSDGSISKDEMESTSVLMPASMTSDSFGSLISYLKVQDTPGSLETAALLGTKDTDAA